MANEFVIKKGLILKADSQLTGSLGVSGDVSGVSGSFSYITGNSPLTIASDLLTINGGVQNSSCCNVSHCITASFFSGSHQGDGSDLTGIRVGVANLIGTTMTPSLKSIDKMLIFSNAAACEFKIPRNGLAPYPTGCEFKVMNTGAGTTTITREHPSITFYRSGSAASTDFDIEQYEVVTIKNIAANKWICYP